MCRKIETGNMGYLLRKREVGRGRGGRGDGNDSGRIGRTKKQITELQKKKSVSLNPKIEFSSSASPAS